MNDTYLPMYSHKITTDSRHTLGFINNTLERDFIVDASNRK